MTERERYDVAVEAMRAYGEVREVRVTPRDGSTPFDAATTSTDVLPPNVAAALAHFAPLLATHPTVRLGTNHYDHHSPAETHVEVAAYCHDLAGSRCGEEVDRG